MTEQNIDADGLAGCRAAGGHAFPYEAATGTTYPQCTRCAFDAEDGATDPLTTAEPTRPTRPSTDPWANPTFAPVATLAGSAVSW